MQNFFYNGILRLDWGIGNPNKTAILIAQLFIVSLIFFFCKKRDSFIIKSFAIGVSATLLVFLMHTFSRGGMIALCLSLLPFFIVYRKKIRKQLFLTAIGIIIFSFYAKYLTFDQRALQGLFTSDKSIENRLTIWKSVPAMMHSAPYGWGFGNAGISYMKWFQDFDTAEKYRTLVNSHFTWLIEGGWIFRIFYISGWLIILFLSFPTEKYKWKVFSFSLWLILGIGMLFSSVGELIYLWILPVLSLFPIMWYCRDYKYLKNKINIIAILIIVFSVSIIMHWVGSINNNIKQYKNKIILGQGDVDSWIVYNKTCFGEYEYAKNLRKLWKNKTTNRTIAIVGNINLLDTTNKSNKVILPNVTEENFKQVARIFQNFDKIVLVNPEFNYESKKHKLLLNDKVVVVFGQNSQSEYIISWENNFNILWLPGYDDFFPDLRILLTHEE